MTILQSMINLYGKTAEQCDKSNEVLAFLVGGSDTNIDCSVTDADTNSVTAISYDSTGTANVSVTVGENAVISGVQCSALNPDDFQESFDTLMVTYGIQDILSYDKLINNANQTGCYYETIADISHGFITNTRQDSATLIGLINSKVNLSLEDREKLSGLIQSAQTEGKVSQYSWLGILKSVYGAEKDKLENSNSLEIVDGSPYIIKTAIQLVGTILQTVIQSVISVMIAFCGVILRIAAIVFSAVNNLIQKAISTDIGIVVDDNTNYIMGSPIAKTFDRSEDSIYEDKIVYSSNYSDYKYYDRLNNGIVQTAPGVDMYAWQPRDKMYIVNGRLCVNIDPDRLRTYIRRRVNFTSEQQGTAYKCEIVTPLWPIVFNDDEENFYLNVDETIKTKIDHGYAAKAMMCSLAAVGLPFFQQSGNIYFESFNDGFNGYTMYDLAALCMWVGFTSNLDDFNAKNHATLYRKIWYALSEGSDATALANFSDDDVYTVTGDDVTPKGVLYSTGSFCYSYNIPIDILHCLLGCEINQWNLLFVPTYNKTSVLPVVVDAVPTGYGFTPAQFDITEVVMAVATIAVFTTAAFIAGNVLKKAMRHKKRIKQLDKTKQLSEKREAYIANPTKENAVALNKAVDKYNRQGRMFGWDQYDLTNNWFTPRSAAGFSGSADLFYGMNTKDTTSNYIIELITGKTPR